MKTVHRIILGLFFSTPVASLGGCTPIDTGCDSTKQSHEFGSCPNSNIPKGQAGGPCYGRIGDFLGQEHCDEGVDCFRDKCWTCGGQDELCCDGACAPGFTCAKHDDYPKTCSSNCGANGQQPCPGGVCQNFNNNGVCSSSMGDSCGNGSNGYVIQYEDTNGCLHPNGPFLVEADSAQDVETCFPAPLGYTIYKVFELNETWVPDEHVFRQDCNSAIPDFGPDDATYIKHYSGSEAEACVANNHCAALGNCTLNLCS